VLNDQCLGLSDSCTSLISPEITIEVNPDDVTEEFAAALSGLPVNRVSMGAQTFSDERLRFLRRRHTAAQVAVAVERLRQAGIANISIDLMYGFPGETLADWQCDIDQALALNVEHLSAYCLMVEEGTPLFEIMRNGKHGKAIASTDRPMVSTDRPEECSEELEREMYYTLKERLEAAGYEHYEISNFAKTIHPSFREPSNNNREPLTTQFSYRSRHNSNYWHDTPYIGLGAAAHSYDGEGRQWNVSDIMQYIEGIEKEQPVFEREELDDDTRYNDRITTALRTREGLRLGELSARHRHYLLDNARRYIDSGLLVLDNDSIRLSRDGLFVSDMVMSELIFV
jgi:oxygen-independent coproporphyrinogen-3 oxidase